MKLLKLLAIFCALSFIAACGIVEEPLASLQLNFQPFKAKNIVPDESMDVVLIEVHGDGPDATTFDVSSAGENVTVEQLLPGSWTISAIGKNDVGTQIAAGSAAATLVIGTTTPVSITLIEDAGDGTLDLTLTWEPDVVQVPVPYGLLTAASDSTEYDISADLVANLGTLITTHTAPYAADWYAFVYQMYDDTVLTGGYATAVRLAEGLTTTGNIHLYVSAATGDFVFDFTTDMRESVVLTTSHAEGDVTVYGSEIVTFTADGGEAGVYAWYVQGNIVSVASSYAVDAALYDDAEFFNLDVIFFSADAKKAGSSHWVVTKSNNVYECTVLFTPSAAGLTYNLLMGWENGPPTYPIDIDGTTIAGVNQIDVTGIPAGDFQIRLTVDGVIKYLTTGTSTPPPDYPYTFPIDPDANIFDFGVF